MSRPLSLLEELMLAILAADDDRRRECLMVLRGESASEQTTVPLSGPALMRMGAAAKYLGVSRATLWRMVRDGRLDHVEVRRDSYRLRRIDLDRMAGIKRGSVTNSKEENV